MAKSKVKHIKEFNVRFSITFNAIFRAKNKKSCMKQVSNWVGSEEYGVIVDDDEVKRAITSEKLDLFYPEDDDEDEAF